MAAVRALVSPMDAERAAVVLDVLTNRLEQVAQAVADGATLGAETSRPVGEWGVAAVVGCDHRACGESR